MAVRKRSRVGLLLLLLEIASELAHEAFDWRSITHKLRTAIDIAEKFARQQEKATRE